MKSVTLGQRPAVLPPRCKLYDFHHEKNNVYVRVSVRLREGANNSIVVDAQAFQVTADGDFIAAPDGRPSRTVGSEHTIATTSVGDTHTLGPGWVRIVGDYDASTFEKTAPQVAGGKPSNDTPPDFNANPTGQYYDTTEGVGYRWSLGEVHTIALGKANELLSIAQNSAPLSGLDF